MNRRIISFDLDQTLLDHSTYSIPDKRFVCVRSIKGQFYYRFRNRTGYG